jgi:DNA repair protein RadD
MLKLRYYQADAISAFKEYVAENWGKSPLIVMPTGCISGDTIINENRCTLGRKKRIDKMYAAFNGLKKHKYHNYDKNFKTYVRSLINGSIQLNEIESILYSGIKKVLKLELKNGFTLKATPEHKIMTSQGWIELQYLYPGQQVMCDTLKSKKYPVKEKTKKQKTYDTVICNLWYHPYAAKTKTNKEKRGYTKRVELHRAIFESYINNLTLDEYKHILKTDEKKSKNLIFVDPSIYDIHHKDEDHYNNNIINLEKLTKHEHQKKHSIKNKYNFHQGIPIFSEVIAVSNAGMEPTYDIGCYQNHNFVANGIIVHNSGKSLVIAYIVRWMLEFKDTRILLLTHQQELILQTFNELIENFNNEIFLDVGIYSAGLGSRDTSNRIIFAGIQSTYQKAWELGFFDLALIDESHLIPPSGEGMYRTFIQELRKINKNIVIGGLTATPYRMKEGLLTEGEGHIFDDICYEATIKELINPDHFRNRDKQQYLCKLISKSAVNKVDLSQVHIRAGEYAKDEMQIAFEANDLVSRAVKEIIEQTQSRNKVLIFTAGIMHCQDVFNKFIEAGMSAASVHSKQKNEINQKNIQDFKDGKIKYLINVRVLTTGFNEKAIDCIVLLFSTLSPGLYVQVVGRGFRMHPSKKDCLILCMGRNIETHGPVDAIIIRKKKNGKGREVSTCPQKECPQCQALLYPSVRTCPDCGYEFPVEPKHDDEASTASILSEWKKPEEVEFESISYSRHEKKGKPDSLRVDYRVNYYEKYSEWICLEHQKGSYPERKAQAWLKRRCPELTINTIDEAIEHHLEFLEPSRIIVNYNGAYPQITGYIFDNKPKEVPEEIQQPAAVAANQMQEWNPDDIPF